jgi:Flp pilus assembly protein TadG
MSKVKSSHIRNVLGTINRNKIMKVNCSKKQRGAVVPLVTIALPVLLLAAGWALDFGHVFVNKTRLQNALDATALSAAIVINYDVNKSTAAATAKGKETFNLFKAASGNNELAGLNEGALVFDYSRTLVPFTPGTNPPAFVRVTSTNMLQIRPVLIRILSQFSNNIPVPAIATAGPVGQNCNLVPLVVCPATSTPANGTPQIGCNTAGCNGIPFETKVCLKGGTDAQKSATCQGGQSGQNASLPTGNFGLLRFDGFAGGADIRALLAGSVNTCANTASWENGNKVGPVSQGIDDRFAADLVQTPYPDVVAGVKGYPEYIADTAAQLAKIPVPKGIANNRVMAIPVVDDCTKTPVNIVAASCFLMTEKATHKGTVNEIVGELTSVCPGPGAFDPTNPVLFGPYKIVLYKSPGSGDS